MGNKPRIEQTDETDTDRMLIYGHFMQEIGRHNSLGNEDDPHILAHVYNEILWSIRRYRETIPAEIRARLSKVDGYDDKTLDRIVKELQSKAKR